MNITQFGSCRANCLTGIPGYDYTGLSEAVSYTHSTKEHLQLLDFLEGKKSFPYPLNRYCFRTSIISQPSNVEFNSEYVYKLGTTDLFLIEVCSSKVYAYNDYCLHHLASDRRFGYWRSTDPKVDSDVWKREQSLIEIEEDMLMLRERLKPKAVLFMTHIDAKVGSVRLAHRVKLIAYVENICQTHGIPVFNPTVVLKTHKQEDILSPDAGHYTERGMRAVGTLLARKIEEIMQCQS